MNTCKTRPLLMLTALGLTACDFAPHYDPPKTAIPDKYKEAVPPADLAQGWQLAEPRDAQIPAKWWQGFQDPVLDELESRVAISNQTVVAAEANYRAARALVAQAQAAFFPTLSLDPSVTRSRSSASISNSGSSSGAAGGGAAGTGATGASTSSSGNNAPRTVYSLPLEASYQLDLWGSVRNSVAQERDSAQASAAQVVTALLSTQSNLAQDYFQLRAVDEQRRILEATLTDYEASIHLIQTLMNTGIDSSEDLAQAQNQLFTAEAQATDLGIARAQYEHAIAVLIGVPPAVFSLPPQPFRPVLPTVPVALPSQLLERRADIADAERQVAAANAQIGIARAAYFPSLTLTASGGYEATGFSHLFDWPNRFWSVGPALAQTLFEGGAKRAAVAQARAQNDAAAANYRGTVLAAFQSVEDNLASMRILTTELTQRHQATVAAQRTVELSAVRFKNGVDSYLNVIAAQNTFLSSRESELQVQLERQIASINLINNLGGGWTVSDWPKTEHLVLQGARAAGPGQVPGDDATGTPNPPKTPTGDIRPEDLLKQNAAAMAPTPP